MRFLITFFAFILLSSNLYAEYPIAKLELNTKISDYFSKREIRNYTWEMRGYGLDEKYSLIAIMNPKEVLSVNYTAATIAYSNDLGLIEYVAGFIKDFPTLDQCLAYRDDQISYSNFDYSYKKDIAINKSEKIGIEQDKIIFAKPGLSVTFNCDRFENRINYRLDYLTNSFNSWVVGLEGIETEYQ